MCLCNCFVIAAVLVRTSWSINVDGVWTHSHIYVYIYYIDFVLQAVLLHYKALLEVCIRLLPVCRQASAGCISASLEARVCQKVRMLN